MFRVEAESEELVGYICSAASEIRDALGDCGLQQTHTLSIEVVKSVSHPLGNCLAYFDCEYDLIRLTEPSEYQSILDPAEPYSQLPSRVLFRALLTHELSHALVTQSAGAQEIDIVDQEYIAAAMELDLMEAQYRDILLRLAPVDLPPKEALIDIWVYVFLPRKFAVNAWQHFQTQEDGCVFIQQIVAGGATFAKAMRPELQ